MLSTFHVLSVMNLWDIYQKSTLLPFQISPNTILIASTQRVLLTQLRNYTTANCVLFSFWSPPRPLCCDKNAHLITCVPKCPCLNKTHVAVPLGGFINHLYLK